MGHWAFDRTRMPYTAGTPNGSPLAEKRCRSEPRALDVVGVRVTVVVLTEVVGDADDVAVGVAEDVAAEDVAAEDVAVEVPEEDVAVGAPGAKRAWWKSVQVSR